MATREATRQTGATATTMATARGDRSHRVEATLRGNFARQCLGIAMPIRVTSPGTGLTGDVYNVYQFILYV